MGARFHPCALGAAFLPQALLLLELLSHHGEQEAALAAERARMASQLQALAAAQAAQPGSISIGDGSIRQVWNGGVRLRGSGARACPFAAAGPACASPGHSHPPSRPAAQVALVEGLDVNVKRGRTAGMVAMQVLRAVLTPSQWATVSGAALQPRPAALTASQLRAARAVLARACACVGAQVVPLARWVGPRGLRWALPKQMPRAAGPVASALPLRPRACCSHRQLHHARPCRPNSTHRVAVDVPEPLVAARSHQVWGRAGESAGSRAQRVRR